jgi:uncharacterized lipoprotein YmbA
MKIGALAQRSACVALLAAILVTQGGCASSPEPQFYTLVSSPGRTFASGPLHIQLRRPGLPGYLDRTQIVCQEQPG